MRTVDQSTERRRRISRRKSPGIGALTIILALVFNGSFLGSIAETFQQVNLRAAADYSRERLGLSFLAIQNGKIVFEEYQNGNSADSRQKIYSGTKGFWAVAAMVAVQEGILSLDEPVSNTITEWQREGDPRKLRITVLELLQFTDGMEPAFPLNGDSVQDRNAFAIRMNPASPPGQIFTYGPSHLQIFCELLRRKLLSRNDTPIAFMERKVLVPLGLHGLDFKTDERGNPLLATGFKLTAREWARMGELILRGGVYRGLKIVDAGELGLCFRGSWANPAFGIGFWTNSESASGRARELNIEDMLELDWRKQDWSHACICRDAPPDLIASIGSGYQRLFVVPSLNLVIVRQGTNARFSDGDFLRLILGR